MDEIKTTVSHSELEAFLVCERKHYYGYGLNLTSIVKSDSLSRGTFGHALVEKIFNYRLEHPDESIDAAFSHMYLWIAENLFNEEEPDVAAYWTDVMGSLKDFQNKGGLGEFEVLAVEIRSEAPITEHLSMSLVIDLVVRDKAGKVGVIDHKFITRNYYGDQTEVMPQLPRYIVALRAQGLPVDWVAYSEFNWKAKKWDMHRVEVNEARIATVEREFHEAARRVMSRRWEAAASPDGLYRWGQEALRTYNTLVCDRCPFKKLCIAEQNNDDPQFVLDSLYRVKEKKDGPEQAERTDSSNGNEGE